MALEQATLTPRQEERRRRVILAALDLGNQGGYDAVQMREVSAAAGVALGTIYRYFSSKDHLLAAAMAEWTGELEERLAKAPARGDTLSDRTVNLLRRAWRAMEKSPRLSAALVRALSSSDEGVAEAADEVTDRFGLMVKSVLEGVEPDAQDDIVAVLGHVWHSALVSWVNGRITFSAVGDELDRAARLLLDPYA